MKRKHEAKNDFFYAFVMFAMFAVVVVQCRGGVLRSLSRAYFVDFGTRQLSLA